MNGIIGFLSLIFTIGAPVAVIYLLISIYKIKRNSETQVAQNERIIQLLEKEKP